MGRRAGLILIALLATACESRVERAPGVLAPDDPVQKSVRDEPFALGEFTLHPRARVSIDARVLHRARYRSGRDAELAPVDLALGWGPMSDSVVLDRMDIDQNSRCYMWQAAVYPIPRIDIVRHSANMHMIPANDEIRGRLLDVRAGEIVTIEGLLVDVTSADNWRWRTSMTRNDAGPGACELVYVETLSVR
ncbi:MAG: hypothetical protein KBD01_07150 [Acidobacteria bacterium]|nr:hypothetical protein [Acidobacteriota bacterium]